MAGEEQVEESRDGLVALGVEAGGPESLARVELDDDLPDVGVEILDPRVARVTDTIDVPQRGRQVTTFRLKLLTVEHWRVFRHSTINGPYYRAFNWQSGRYTHEASPFRSMCGMR